MGQQVKPKVAPATDEVILSQQTAVETDFKFIIAIIVIAAFIVMLAIPLARNQDTLFSTVATAMTGIVGTIIGYYFGSNTTQTTTPTTK